MTDFKPLLTALIAAGFAASPTVASEGPSITEPEAYMANPLAGRAVVVGRDTRAKPCFTCHGLDGAGDGSGAFPRLSGQLAFYLYKQLLDYAAGRRPNQAMIDIARELTEAQMVDVAAYYAVQDAPPPPPEQADPQLLALGRTLAQEGLPDKDIQACHWCHGELGRGLPPSFPYLAGQYAPYLEFQLQLWKKGLRKNDPLNVMKEIADRLSELEIRALALYFASLAPPRDEEEQGITVREALIDALD